MRIPVVLAAAIALSATLSTPTVAQVCGGAQSISLDEGNSVAAAGRISIDVRAVGGTPPPADIGAGSFTIELWLKSAVGGQLRPVTNFRSPGDSEQNDFDWIYGNIFIDRSVWDPRYPVFGASIHRDGDPGDPPSAYDRGVIRFGVRPGTIAGGGSDPQYTLQGSREVLDGQWHHVALVRDASNGRLSIYVDGTLDAQSSSNFQATTADLSYPNGAELVGQPSAAANNPERSPFIIVGTEKHDLGSGSPGFRGSLDEIRLWHEARSAAEILSSFDQVLSPGPSGPDVYFPLDEGSGTALGDLAGGPSAQLLTGTPSGSDGGWSSEGAPLSGCSSACSDGIDNDGDLLIDFPADTGCTDADDDTEELCGDGQVEAAEQCDDGNTSPGDGCDSTCAIETGFDCTGEPSVCTLGEGPPNSGQERCLVSMNKAAHRLANGAASDMKKCIRNAAVGRTHLLGDPPQQQTAQACLTNDVFRRVERLTDRLNDRDQSLCGDSALHPDRPAYGYSGATLASAATVAEVEGLAGDLFGSDLDAAIQPTSTQSARATCQRQVVLRVSKFLGELWTTARKAKESALRCSRESAPSNCSESGPVPRIQSSSELELSMLAPLTSDPEQRLVRRAEKLREVIERKCPTVSGEIATMFPGACAGAAPSAFGVCAEEQVRCRFCRNLNAADAVSLDCDLFDDDLPNASCP